MGQNMRIETTVTVKVFTIFDAPKLHPITVVLQDFGAGCGRLIVECFGTAWSAYWGAMGHQTIAEFITDSSPEYIATKLEPTTHRQTKANSNYLMRITEAVHSAMRSNVELRGAHK